MYAPGNPAGKKQFLKHKKSIQKAAHLSTNVVAAVKAIVKGQQETKYSFHAQPVATFNSTVSSTAEWYNCLPDVPLVGTASSPEANPWARIGSKVKPTSLRLNWAIGYGPEITRSCDNQVVLYIFKMRRYKAFSDMQNFGNVSEFLDQAQGGLIGFDGYLQQTIVPLNKVEYILVKKVIIHLQKGVGYINNNEPENDNTYAGNGNKSFSYYSTTVKVPTLVYEEGNVLQPSNFGLAWCLGYAHSDGASPDVLNRDLSVVATQQLYFKDG